MEQILKLRGGTAAQGTAARGIATRGTKKFQGMNLQCCTIMSTILDVHCLMILLEIL